MAHGISAPWLHAREPRVLIIVGPSSHPPGSHEVAAGARLLQHCIENIHNLPGVKADVVEGWPDKALRDTASTVVFSGDFFPPNRLPNASQNLADLETMMQRGCGIVCVHYANGVHGDDVTSEGDHPLLLWTGVTMPVRSVYKPLRLPKKASRRCESSQWSLTPVARCILVAGLLWLWTWRACE